MPLQKKFIDLDFNFGTHPATKDVVKVFDEVAIKASLKHLVLTEFYSRPFHPEIGSQVAGLLFEPNTHLTQYAIKHTIKQVIENFDPRVTVSGVEAEFTDTDNAYNVNVYLNVVGLLESITLEFLLNRIR